jgi:hypothetical protein
MAKSTSYGSTNFGAEGFGRRFRRKGKTLFELHLDSMIDPWEHFLGGEVLRHFPPNNAGLQLA